MGFWRLQVPFYLRTGNNKLHVKLLPVSATTRSVITKSKQFLKNKNNQTKSKRRKNI